MDQPVQTPPSAPDAIPSPTHVSPLGAVLSYLIPGLGQIVQGRVAKGLLFFVCIYVLFFYGMYLGAAEVRVDQRTYRMNGSVYLPTAIAWEKFQNAPEARPGRIRGLVSAFYARPQFLGQFWMGIAVWPAIAQYWTMDPIAEAERLRQLEDRYDALERLKADDPETKQVLKDLADLEAQGRHPTFGDFMREPSHRTINVVHNGTDKRVELAWVFTVIAGVLNIMVIYDAYSGPAHRPEEPKKPEPPKE